MGKAKKLFKKINSPILRPVQYALGEVTGANRAAKASKEQAKGIMAQNAQIIEQQQQLAQQQATPAPAPEPVQQVQQQVQSVQADAVRRDKRRAKIRTNLAGATNLNMSGQ